MTFSEKRSSLDNIVNNHGRRLIDMCKSTHDLFNDVIGFQIRDFEELLSDIHCPIELCFDFNSKSRMPLINSKE